MIIDELSNTTSHELMLAISTELNNDEHEQPTTLGSLLASMQSGLYQELASHNNIDDKLEFSLMDELTTLINHYGDDMLAEHFIDYGSTNDLSVVLNFMLSELEPDQPPTLTTLRIAIQNGMAAHLVAVGELDVDNSVHLIDEIDDLIRLHGEDTPAEHCLL